MTVRDLAAPPVSPVVWEAALGRRVVLIEDRLWVSAREKARAMLGGEPEYVVTPTASFVSPPFVLFDTGTDFPLCAYRSGEAPIIHWEGPLL